MAVPDPACVCHLVRGAGCLQGRACPIREMEAAINVALDPRTEFPAPKGKPMNYRLKQSLLVRIWKAIR